VWKLYQDIKTKGVDMKRAVFLLVLVGVMVLYGTVTSSRMNRLVKGARFEVWGNRDSLALKPTTADTLLFTPVLQCGDFDGMTLHVLGQTNTGHWRFEYQEISLEADTTYGKWRLITADTGDTTGMYNLSGVPFQGFIRFRAVCVQNATDTLYIYFRVNLFGK